MITRRGSDRPDHLTLASIFYLHDVVNGERWHSESFESFLIRRKATRLQEKCSSYEFIDLYLV